MTTTQLICGESVFDELAQEWDDLAGRGVTDTPFQSLAYQQAWWTNLQPPGSSLRTITVRDEGGDLLAIACFYLFDGVIHFNGCVEETDYLDLIASADHVEMAWAAVFDCLFSAGFPHWSLLELCNVPADSPTRQIVPAIAKQRGLPFNEEIQEVCPVISLPGSFDEYLMALPKKQRHEVRRKLRRAEAAGAVIRIVGAHEDIETAVDDFLTLLQKSTVEKRDWLNEGRRAVFHKVAQAAQSAGTLNLLFAEVEGKKAAALFNFAYKNRIWVYNSGLDPTMFGNLSLGVVVTAKAIEAAIERQFNSFDFLRGGETYKYRFGAEDTMIYRLRAERRPAGP